MIIAILCNSSCIASNYNDLNKTFLNNIKQAKLYESQGNIHKANEYYIKADKNLPNRFESSYGLAKTYGWLKKENLADFYYKNLLKKQPNNIQLEEQYAYFLRDKGSYYLAIKKFNELFIKTNQKKYKLNIAEVYFAQANYDDVINLLINDNKKDLIELKLLADSYFNKADYKNAQIYLKKYLLVDNSDEKLIKYAKSLFYSGNSTDAKKILESIKPNNEIYYILSDIYLSLGEFNKASIILEKLLEFKPNNVELNYKYANSLMASTQFEKANLVLSKLISLKKNNNEIITLYVDSCFALLKFKKASEVLTENVKIFPDDEILKVKLVKSLEAQGKIEEISPYIDDIEKISYNNTDVCNILGNYYTYKQDFNKALTYYQQTYKEKSADEETIFKIAETYRFKNENKNAEQYYKNLLNSEIFGSQAKTKLAYIKLQEGKLDEAKNMFMDISQKKMSVDALKGLAEVYYAKEDYYESLDTLERIIAPTDNSLLLVKIYYKLLKGSTAIDSLKGNNSKEANELRTKIEIENSFKIEPIYKLEGRNGNLNQNLTSSGYGFTASKTVFPDKKVYTRFEITPYKAKNNSVKSTVTSYTLGSSGKVGLKTDYISEIQLDSFSNGGQIILGKAITNYRLSDNYKFNAGFIRSSVKETMLSAAGLIPSTGPFEDQLTGRVVDNKFIFNASAKLPYNSYLYSSYNLGFKKGKNSSSNPYQEILGGVGKVLYSTDENKFLSQIISGYNVYYTGYKNNKLNYGGASLENNLIGSDGGDTSNIGGYFSPKGILVNNLSLKLKGAIKPLNLNYQNESFMGVQNIQNTDSDLTWGNTISLIWNEKGRIGFKLGYNTNFYGVAKHQNFFIQLLLSDFMRRQKCVNSL